MTREALKPCAHCGGDAEVIGDGGYWSVACGTTKCFAEFSPVDWGTEESAIKAWNTR